MSVDQLIEKYTSSKPALLIVETNPGWANLQSIPKILDQKAKEFDLLLHFVQNPGRVYSRTHLLDQVWGYTHSGYEHTVNSHINRLRSKIEKDPAQPTFIQTVWGVGYKFSETLSK